MIKKTFLFLIILVCIMSVSAVNAEELDINANVTDSNELMELPGAPSDELGDAKSYEVTFLTNKSIFNVSDDDIIWNVKNISEYDELYNIYTEYSFSMLKLDNMNYTIIQFNWNHDCFYIYREFNPEDYLTYGNFYYKLTDGLISEIIDDSSVYDGKHYIYVGMGLLNQSSNLEESYCLVNGNCYKNVEDKAMEASFFYNATEGSDYKRINGICYALNGEIIKEYYPESASEHYDIIDSTFSQSYDDFSYESPILGSIDYYVKINDTYFRVIYGEAVDNSSSLRKYALINGRLYEIKDNAIGSEVILYDDYNINASDVNKHFSGLERFNVKLTQKDGTPIVNANVKITINGREYIRTTDKNGTASMALNLNSGEYAVFTQYGNKVVLSKVNVMETVLSTDFTKMFRNATQYSAILFNSNGDSLPYNTPVEININGVFYTRYTEFGGRLKMNINLNPGTYILTTKNPVTGEMHTTEITVLPIIVDNKDLTKYYRNASQYHIKILGDDGNPVGEGVNVTFNINGVFYTRITYEGGFVKMNINLEPGEYIITAEYKGLRASNNIRVLSVLSANDLSMKFRDGSAFEAKLLDGQGNPFAGQSITFNINGVFYTRVTDENGIARLNINLMAGDYVITTSYNGLNIANNIKIAPDPMYYTIGTNPLDYNYYMDDANRFSWDWHYIAQSDAYFKTIYDIYGNQGMEARDVSYGVKYICYEASTGKEFILNEAGEIIMWSYGRGYTEEYIRYDQNNNIIERGRWVYY